MPVLLKMTEPPSSTEPMTNSEVAVKTFNLISPPNFYWPCIIYLPLFHYDKLKLSANQLLPKT